MGLENTEDNGRMQEYYNFLYSCSAKGDGEDEKVLEHPKVGRDGLSVV